MKKLQTNARTMIVMAAIALSTGAAASAQYRFLSFDVPGATATYAYGISDLGLIAGTYAVIVNGSEQTFGFTYDPHLRLWNYPIADPKAPTSTWVFGVDMTADLVAGAYALPSGNYVGMLEYPGNYRDFNPENCGSSMVTGVNRKGEAGTCAYLSSTDQQMHTMGWVMGRNDPETFLYPGSLDTFVTGVDLNLEAVGYYYDPPDRTSHGFLRAAEYEWVTFDYPGAINTVVGGISSSFVVTGSYWMADPERKHGFIFANQQYTTIDFPHAFSTYIGQSNDKGWFVGSYVDGNGITHGFWGQPRGR